MGWYGAQCVELLLLMVAIMSSTLVVFIIAMMTAVAQKVLYHLERKAVE